MRGNCVIELAIVARRVRKHYNRSLGVRAVRELVTRNDENRRVEIMAGKNRGDEKQIGAYDAQSYSAWTGSRRSYRS